MCSVTDDSFNLEKVSKSISSCNEIDPSCRKCAHEKAVIRLQKKHSYCRNCFVSMVTHKFRSTLGKTKLLRPEDRVLNVFLGNASSSALLHLLQRGIEEKTHKKLQFCPIVLFIDGNETPMTEIREILEFLKCSGFECYVVKLSSVYNDLAFKNIQDDDITEYLAENNADHKLLTLFTHIKSNTAKIDLLLRIRNEIEIKAARLLKCRKILTPESGTELSVRLLSNVALGRGSQIASDVAVFDKKIPEVCVVRPLREITTKELMFYNVYNNIKFHTIVPDFFTLQSNTSLQQETKSFIYRLQEEFPSTVYTIFHIGDKLKFIDSDGTESVCDWCYNYLSSAKSVADGQKCDDKNDEKSSADSNCSRCICKKENADDPRTILKSFLCYGCQRILDEMDLLIGWPSCLLKRIEPQLNANRNIMKKSFQDFLL